MIKRKKISLEQLKEERNGVPLSLGELLVLENNPVVLTEEYAEKLIDSRKERQILDIRNNNQDRKVAEKRFGLNTYLPKDTTLIYQNGIDNTWEEAKATAENMSKHFNSKVGVINNETVGNPLFDIVEMRDKRPNIKDILTFETYRKLNNLGNKALIITHSRGNDDFQDVARTNFYDEKFNNLSNLSVGSPISENKIKIASKKLGTNYLGQVNDPSDPVTWISGFDGNDFNISKPSLNEHLFEEYLKEPKVNELIRDLQGSKK